MLVEKRMRLDEPLRGILGMMSVAKRRGEGMDVRGNVEQKTG